MVAVVILKVNLILILDVEVSVKVPAPSDKPPLKFKVAAPVTAMLSKVPKVTRPPKVMVPELALNSLVPLVGYVTDPPILIV